MRRKLLAVVVLFTLGGLAWEYVPIQVQRWDSSFELSVAVLFSNDQPRSVSCEAFPRYEQADEAIVHLLPPVSRMWSTIADPFEGRLIPVQVAVSGRTSPFGRELRRSQHRYLAVIATMPDGRRLGKVVEIPDSRVTREVSVAIP